MSNPPIAQMLTPEAASPKLHERHQQHAMSLYGHQSRGKYAAVTVVRAKKFEFESAAVKLPTEGNQHYLMSEGPETSVQASTGASLTDLASSSELKWKVRSTKTR